MRDPYPELARLRREEPIQRIDMSAMPGEEGKPVFIVYRYEDAQQMLRDNLTFSSSGVIAAFGPVLGERVMLGMDEPVHGRLRGAGVEGVLAEGLGATGRTNSSPASATN